MMAKIRIFRTDVAAVLMRGMQREPVRAQGRGDENPFVSVGKRRISGNTYVWQ